MSIKEPLDRYGLYIPPALFVIFTFPALAKGGTDNWAQMVLTNALTYALGCQLISAGIMHIFRFQPGNAGYMFYWDLFMPPTLIVLYWLAHNAS